MLMAKWEMAPILLKSAIRIARKEYMKAKPRVFVSVPDDRHLDDRRKALKRAIVSFITRQGFDVVGFESEQFGAGLPMNFESWTVEKANRLIRRSDGVLILALARMRVRILNFEDDISSQNTDRIFTLPTPYNHL